MTIEEIIKKYDKLLKDYVADPYYRNDGVQKLLIDITQDIKSINYIQDKILLVEDGSIDLEKEEETLNKMGYKVIIYRQGANKPEILGE